MIKGGEVFCENCGDCIYCYGDDPCWVSGVEDYHYWIEPEGKDETSTDTSAS